MSHLKAKIQEVIAQADVDHDGVVRYDGLVFGLILISDRFFFCFSATLNFCSQWRMDH